MPQKKGGPVQRPTGGFEGRRLGGWSCIREVMAQTGTAGTWLPQRRVEALGGLEKTPLTSTCDALTDLSGCQVENDLKGVRQVQGSRPGVGRMSWPQWCLDQAGSDAGENGLASGCFHKCECWVCWWAGNGLSKEPSSQQITGPSSTSGRTGLPAARGFPLLDEGSQLCALMYQTSSGMDDVSLPPLLKGYAWTRRK